MDRDVTRSAYGLSALSISQRRPARIEEYETLARNVLPRYVFEYIASGADPGVSLTANTQCFALVVLVPRVMRPVAHVDTSVCIGPGHAQDGRKDKVESIRLSDPFFVAPFGLHRMAHPAGELATAAACAAQNVPLGCSQHSTVSLRKVATAVPALRKFFQLYVLREAHLTQALVDSAIEMNCEAIIITVDSPVFGFRSVDTENGLNALPNGMHYENYESEVFQKIFGQSGKGIDDNIEAIFEPKLEWSHVRDVFRLCEKSGRRLQVMVKGILHEEDAVLAAQAGASVVYISNHGGRQFGSAPAALSVVSTCRRALDLNEFQNVSVVLDGGIRSGDDILKAVAAGADAVGLGRIILWALAADGADGVQHVIEMLRAEIRRGMQLLGCRSLQELREARMLRLADIDIQGNGAPRSSKL